MSEVDTNILCSPLGHKPILLHFKLYPSPSKLVIAERRSRFLTGSSPLRDLYKHNLKGGNLESSNNTKRTETLSQESILCRIQTDILLSVLYM